MCIYNYLKLTQCYMSITSQAGDKVKEPINHVLKIFMCCVLTFCVFRGLQKEEIVLLTHGDSVDKVADGFKVVARSGNIVAGENPKTFVDFIFKNLSGESKHVSV